VDTNPSTNTTTNKATQAASGDLVSLPDAPSVPGLSFRHFRGDEDYPGILSVNNGSKIADGLEHDLHTLETIRRVYGSTHNHDPLKDVLIAEVNGEMVAYIRTYWERELEGPRVYWHISFVLPQWREKGIGRALVRWAALARLRRMAPRRGRLPAQGEFTSAHMWMVTRPAWTS
jgi:mycothiol synthase